MKLKKEQVLEFITEYSSDLIHDEFPKNYDKVSIRKTEDAENKYKQYFKSACE